MSIVNTPENTRRPEDLPDPEDAARSDAEAADTGAPADAAEREAPEKADPAASGTTLYVRRGRTPTLGFWVALAILVPAVAALFSAPFFDFADLSGVVNFVLVVAVFVGLPLAAIAAFVDARMHRDRPRRRR